MFIIVLTESTLKILISGDNRKIEVCSCWAHFYFMAIENSCVSKRVCVCHLFIYNLSDYKLDFYISTLLVQYVLFLQRKSYGYHHNVSVHELWETENNFQNKTSW